MKILDINTHSLIEDDYERKCGIFTREVLRLKPDFITMQEVNQSIFSPILKDPPPNFRLSGEIPLRKNNHAFKVWKMLKNEGLEYNFCWCGFKLGYGKLQEGLAIFSLSPIDELNSFYLTQSENYLNWKTRKALVIQSKDNFIATTHTGWWDDKDEPLKDQLDILFNNLKHYENLILTGDFNSPASDKNTGYSYILSGGFFDTFTLADMKDSGNTVMGKIDGWNSSSDKRIDYIFSNTKIKVRSSYTIFGGEDRISDHLGIIVTI